MANLGLSVLQRPVWRLPWPTLLQYLVFAVVVLLVLYPVGLLLVSSFQVSRPGAPAEFGFEPWAAAFSAPSVGAALWNTLALIAARQSIAFTIAVVIAWLLARTDMPGRRSLEFMFWIAFFLPTIPVVQAWVLLLDRDYGVINWALTQIPFVRDPPFDIHSFSGIVWVHLAHNAIAIKIILLVPLFRAMDSSFEEAARLSGSSAFGTVPRITLPIMAPGLFAVFLIGTIYTLHSFEIEAILGPPFRFSIFSTEVFAMINQERPNFAAATALSSFILIGMVPFIIAHRWVTVRNQYTTVGGRYRGARIALGRWKLPAFAAILALALLTTLVPLVMLLVGSFTRKWGFFEIERPLTAGHWVRVLADGTFLASLKNSLLLGVGTAVLGMVGFGIIGYIAVRTRFALGGALDFLTWLPSVLPGIILSLGLLWLFLGTPAFRPLYGGLVGMVIATFIGCMTIGVQMIKSNLVQLGPELEETARVGGGSWWQMYRHVILPLTMPIMLLTGALSFALAIRNVSNVVFLGSGNTRPLSLLQLDFMVEGWYESASVVGIVLVVLTVSVAAIARLYGSRFELVK
jgi:iron(III) transport system permease protein